MATGGLCITSEQKNYNKICHLLIGIGTNQIRSVFDRRCKMLSNSTAGLLKTNEQRLQTLRTSRSQKGGPPKIINDTQWRLMYPTPPAAANSEQFDITLLMILLRNICGLKSPNDHVWTRAPYSSDVSVEVDLVRMREFRNTLQHMPGTTIKDSEFERLWFDISVVLVRLGAKQNDIDELKLASMDPSETERHQQTLKQWKESDDELKDRLDRMDEKQDKALENDDDIRQMLQKLTQSGMSLAKDADSVHKKRDDQCLDAANKCEEELRQYYKEYLSNITQLPWWDGADKVKLDRVYVDMGLKTKKEGIGIQNQNLFSSRKDCENPKRILIEADAGHGKSTLCKKLALDWAEKKIFDQFKLVFFLELRHLQGRQIPLKDAFFESLLPEDSPINRDDLWDFIKSHQSEVLFILDGLDEVHRDHLPGDIQKMLHSKILRNCKMISTSRIIRDNESRDQYDSLLLIRSIEMKSLADFIKLHFQAIGQTQYADRFLYQFNQIRSSSVDLLFLMQTPLNALLMCEIWLENGKLPQENNKLYEEILDCFVKLYMKKIGRSGDVDFENEIQQQLLILGKHSCNYLNKSIDSHEFSKEVSKLPDILGLGLLTKIQMYRKVSSTPVYVFYHATFQEFLAARYIVSLYATDKIEFKKHLEHICKSRRTGGLHHLQTYFLFVVNLMKDRVEDLFCVMREIKFALRFDDILLILKGSDCTSQMISACAKEIPDHISLTCIHEHVNIDRISSSLCRVLSHPSCRLRTVHEHVNIDRINSSLCRVLSHPSCRLRTVQLCADVSLTCDSKDLIFINVRNIPQYKAILETLTVLSKQGQIELMLNMRVTADGYKQHTVPSGNHHQWFVGYESLIQQFKLIISHLKSGKFRLFYVDIKGKHTNDSGKFMLSFLDQIQSLENYVSVSKYEMCVCDIRSFMVFTKIIDSLKEVGFVNPCHVKLMFCDTSNMEDICEYLNSDDRAQWEFEKFTFAAPNDIYVTARVKEVLFDFDWGSLNVRSLQFLNERVSKRYHKFKFIYDIECSLLEILKSKSDISLDFLRVHFDLIYFKFVAEMFVKECKLENSHCVITEEDAEQWRKLWNEISCKESLVKIDLIQSSCKSESSVKKVKFPLTSYEGMFHSIVSNKPNTTNCYSRTQHNTGNPMILGITDAVKERRAPLDLTLSKCVLSDGDVQALSNAALIRSDTSDKFNGCTVSSKSAEIFKVSGCLPDSLKVENT
ncbi:uncharacterized protein [Ptychodera flava]|uniref:uncharacterized protein n=1 Tax=Ptychodera flava TaxID=63121 RepID=UPI003969CEB5